ncbi:MAG: hypothetical protein ACOC22_01050 [bacterium]
MVVKSVIKNNVKPVWENVSLGALSKLNLFANDTTVTANSTKKVTAVGTTQSIKSWFNYVNTEFENFENLNVE